MKQIVVMDRTRAVRFSYESHDFTSIIVSISDPDKNVPSFCGRSDNGVKSVGVFKFWDEIEDKYGCISINDAKEICGFVKKHIEQVDCIIVHCEAGICRSSGTAAAIMKYFNGSDFDIFNNKKYTPNMTCYTRVLNCFHEMEG